MGIVGIVGMVNLSHGGVEGFQTCGFQKHDARIAPSLLKHIDQGDIILGDRAFCSYEFITRITTEKKGARHDDLRYRNSSHEEKETFFENSTRTSLRIVIPSLKKRLKIDLLEFCRDPAKVFARSLVRR